MKKRCVSLFIMLSALANIAFGDHVASSANYALSAYETDMGSFSMSSENYSVSNTIGANFIGIVLNEAEKIISGFIAVVSGEEAAKDNDNYEITNLKAFDAPMGRQISPETWQRDNTPYFIWSIKSETAPVLGYSYSLNTMPDMDADTGSSAVDFAGNPISDGKNIFYVRAITQGTMETPVGEFHLWIDTEPPSISGVSPASASLLTDKKFDITFNLSDALSGVKTDSIDLKVNGSKRIYSVEEDKITAHISSIGDGHITVSVSASDEAGNEMPTEMWSFSVDTTPPKGSVVINNGAAYTNVIYALLHIEASDNYSGVEYMRIGNSLSLCRAGEWQNFQEDVEWKLPPVSGEHTVFIQFKDLAGNISSVYTDSITLDIIAPDTVITGGPSGVSQYTDAFFKFSASEPGCVFSYKIDDGQWSVWSNDNSVFLVNLDKGKHIFSVRAAKDINNNKAIDLEEIDPSPAQRIWFIGEIEEKKTKVIPKLWRLE